MSSIMRWRRGLVVGIGGLLSREGEDVTITSSQTEASTSAPFLLRRRSRFVQSLAAPVAEAFADGLMSAVNLNRGPGDIHAVARCAELRSHVAACEELRMVIVEAVRMANQAHSRSPSPTARLG
jgi:hypothetical protein